jgi:DNA-binding LacI/PurR family transcriptional regulator
VDATSPGHRDSLESSLHLHLTTVDPVSFEVGRTAALTLLRRTEDPRRPAVEVLLEPRLEVRTSTVAPMDMAPVGSLQARSSRG